MKQSYFVRLNVTKAERLHTLLIPISSLTEIPTLTKNFDAWVKDGWSVETILTPFPGQGINASDLGGNNV